MSSLCCAEWIELPKNYMTMFDEYDSERIYFNPNFYVDLGEVKNFKLLYDKSNEFINKLKGQKRIPIYKSVVVTKTYDCNTRAELTTKFDSYSELKGQGKIVQMPKVDYEPKWTPLFTTDRERMFRLICKKDLHPKNSNPQSNTQRNENSDEMINEIKKMNQNIEAINELKMIELLLRPIKY